jgi:hypothetical protein
LAVDGWIMPNGREHRIQRKRHKHRNQYRRCNGDAELMEEATDDAAHESHWQEHRDNREGRRQHCQSDFLGALNGLPCVDFCSGH